MSKNAVWIKELESWFFHPLLQRYNFVTPKTNFFRHLISHLAFFKQPPTARFSFMYKHFRTFFKSRKNEIGIYLLIPFRFSKRTKHTHSLHPNFYKTPKKPEAHRAFRAFVFVISKCSEVKKDAEHLLSMSFSVLRRFISPRFRPQR